MWYAFVAAFVGNGSLVDHDLRPGCLIQSSYMLRRYSLVLVDQPQWASAELARLCYIDEEFIASPWSCTYDVKLLDVKGKEQLWS